MNLNTYPELMTVEEIAEYLRTSNRTILNWASKGEIPAGKIGSEWRFRRDDVKRWIEGQFRPDAAESAPFSVEEIVSKENIFILDDRRKRDVLNHLVKHLAGHPNVSDGDAVTKAIFAREELMSTGIGLQVGVPHVRLPEINAMTVGIALTKKPIEDYDSIDARPIRLVVMVLGREDQHQDHLKFMSFLSNKLKHDDRRELILGSKTKDELYDRMVLK